MPHPLEKKYVYIRHNQMKYRQETYTEISQKKIQHGK